MAAAARPRVSVSYAPIGEPVSLAPPPPAAPPSPAATPIPQAAPAAASRTYNPERDTVVQVADFDEPLPSDGILWDVDANGKRIKRHRVDEKRFGNDFVLEQIRRQLEIALDAIYDFVTIVAGMTGRGATSEQWWRATQSGSAAVNLIFTNLLPDLQASLAADASFGSSNEAFTKQMQEILNTTQKEIAAGVKATDDVIAERGWDAETAKIGKTIFSNFMGNIELDRLQKAVGIADKLKDLREDVAGKTFRSLLGLGSATEAPKVRRSDVPTSAAVPPPAGGAGPERIAAPPTEGTGKRKAESDEFDAKTREVTNPRLLLMRLMLEGKLNDTTLRAWDLIYYNGEYLARSKAAGSKSNAERIKADLEAARAIAKLVGSAGGQPPGNNLAWNRSVENTGLVFLDPQFRAALLMSFERIKNVCGIQHVPLLHFMTHDGVRVNFAKLVALELGEQSALYPGRYQTQRNFSDLRRQRDLLLQFFKSVAYDLSGGLVFGSTYQPFATEQRNQFVEQVNGMNRSGKKPSYAPVDPHAKRRADSLSII